MYIMVVVFCAVAAMQSLVCSAGAFYLFSKTKKEMGDWDSISIQAISTDDKRSIFRTVAADCRISENATDADVEEMLDYEAPTTKEGSCLRACIFEIFGMVFVYNILK